MPERTHFNDAELKRVRLAMRETASHAEVLELRAHDFSKARFLVELQRMRAITNDLERELLDERMR